MEAAEAKSKNKKEDEKVEQYKDNILKSLESFNDLQRTKIPEKTKKHHEETQSADVNP